MIITLDLVEKTQQYLDYIREHVNNVSKAWIEMQEKCFDLSFMTPDFIQKMNEEVLMHDMSKLSKEEFVQYRECFYSIGESVKITDAWEHHKSNNLHHWEAWTNAEFKDPGEWKFHCIHMVIDWMAMGYKFGDTAHEYYEKNKEKIKLPIEAEILIYKIFSRIG